MAHAKFSTAFIMRLCDVAIDMSESRDQTARIRRLRAFAEASTLTCEMFLTAEDFADIQGAWRKDREELICRTHESL